MEWLVQLQGDVKYLKMLKDSIIIPELKIIQEDDRFYLQCKRFNEISNSREVLSEAKKFIPTLNAVSILVLGSYNPIDIFNRVIRVENDGTRNDFVQAKLQVRYVDLPFKCIKVDGSIFSVIPEDAIPKYLELSINNPDVRRIFERVSSNFESPWSLYNIYEDIYENMGGNIPWVNKKDIDRLKATVNSRNLLGINARHGRKYTTNGKLFSDHNNPMTIPEARNFIWTLIINWINYRLDNP